LGTQAAFIGGASATSNVRAGKIFGIPVAGTHAHALVQTYGDDYKAFKAYAETHKDCVFLVDTYDTLRVGVPAIRVAKEMGDKINFKESVSTLGTWLTFLKSSSTIRRCWIYRCKNLCLQ
jgi:nicotinate phosphoribosyltransferase